MTIQIHCQLCGTLIPEGSGRCPVCDAVDANIPLARCYREDAENHNNLRRLHLVDDLGNLWDGLLAGS